MIGHSNHIPRYYISIYNDALNLILLRTFDQNQNIIKCKQQQNNKLPQNYYLKKIPKRFFVIELVSIERITYRISN